MANTVSFRIKLDDGGSFKQVEVNLDELAAAMKQVKKESDAVNGSIVNWAQAGQAADMLASTVGQLNNVFRQLTGAYAEQEVGEAKLARAMRNTMDASDEEVEAIKRLVAEQQRIGIVGDEVQLAAAQELATYLELSSSLETIIPVMNDMVAQQLGLGASAESATQIATMLGKVMNGQTEALSRYGYKFNDAQKEILQFGEESERAAVLAQVVEESVAGMNEALAQTKAGRMQQLANSIGDVKEQLGKVAQSIQPVVELGSEFIITAAGAIKLATSVKSLSEITAIQKLQSLGAAAGAKMQAMAQKILAAAGYQAAAGTTALKVATAALYATLSLGLTLAIQGVIELVTRLESRSRDAAGGLEEMDDAADAYKNASASMRAELAQETVTLENLIKKKEQTADKVAELNRKYGEAFGYQSTAAEWYDTLKNKSADYCKQLAYEAKAKVLASKSGEKQVELDAIKAQMKALEEAGQGQKTQTITVAGSPTIGQASYTKTMKTAYGLLADQADALQADIDSLDQQFRDAMNSAQSLAEGLQSAGDKSADAVSWQKMNLEQLTKAIQDQETKVKGLAGVNENEAKSEASVLKQMKARKDLLEKTYGLDSGSSSKDKYDGKSLIQNASSYKELGNNIKYYQTKLEEADASDAASIRTLAEKIEGLKRQQQAIKDVMDAAGRPLSLDTLEDIDKEISYQQGLRKTASKENLAQIDAEIKRLSSLKTAFEQSSHVSLKQEEITTYEQLNSEIEYYSNALKTAGTKDREQIQLTLNALEKLKKGWDDALDALQKPGDIKTLNTVEELETAIAYYSNAQKKQSATEYAATQQVINALESKKKLIESIASLSGMETEVSGLTGLSGKKLKMELELLGLDGIKTKIRELQKLLDNTKNPLNASQRAQVEQLQASYQAYYNTLKKSNVTFREGWSAVAGMGDSVMNLTELLKGDGNAWQKVSGVIDNFLSMYESFSTIIEIVKTLTAVTNAQTLAEKAKGVATMTTASQTSAASGISVAAAEAQAAAEGAKATAATTSAAAETMSAHAGIPFVGIAIAAALVATMVGVLLSLPKFANGAIAYGPTLGLFGEYAGAANNPEVVAPLNKLRELIGSDGAGFGEVKFVIKGRQLEGILSKMNRINGRTE